MTWAWLLRLGEQDRLNISAQGQQDRLGYITQGEQQRLTDKQNNASKEKIAQGRYDADMNIAQTEKESALGTAQIKCRCRHASWHKLKQTPARDTNDSGRCR